MTDRLHALLQYELDKFGLDAEQPPDQNAWRDFLQSLNHSLELDLDGALILHEGFDHLVFKAVDAFILHDVHGDVIDVNPAACSMLGYTRNEMLGLNVADFEMQIDPGAVWDDIEVGQVETVEGEHLRKDGSTYPAETRIGAFVANGRKVIMALCRDISHREEQQQRLREANERLAVARDEAIRSNRAKSVFLANMSHELRTPLNAVIGYSEMLMDEMRAEGGDGHIPDLERIRTAGEQLLSIINAVLDLSKIEAGKMDLHVERFDVPQLLENIEDTVRPLAAKRDNALDISADRGLYLRSDITKCRQILFNLLSNACKFTSSGRISASAWSTEYQGGDAVGFTVTDTGIGMSEDELDKVFGAFAQADPSTTREYGGTGLGLAISRHFAHTLGGEISVVSEPGEGTSFEVILPYIEGAQSVEVDAVPGRRTSASEGASSESEDGVTVLVVEDDESSRELLRRTLQSEGYVVATAADGREGLSLARELVPDLITLDVMMPTLDGWTLLSLLRKNPKLRDIPIVLISMIDEREKGLALGADHYMSKPIDRRQLLDVLATYYNSEPESGIILIVDDDDDTRDLHRRYLEHEGLTLIEARDGKEALEKAGEHEPSLVILDLMMPEMNGFEFLSEFRSRPGYSSTPVVVVTAHELSHATIGSDYSVRRPRSSKSPVTAETKSSRNSDRWWLASSPRRRTKRNLDFSW